MNPTTHPEEFRKLAVGETLLPSDITEFPHSGWDTTGDAGKTLDHDSYAYFRRKQKQKEQMKYYRKVEIGEVILRGDMWGSTWREVNRAIYSDRETLVSSEPLFRPVEVDDWVEAKDRMPSREDYNPTGFINSVRVDNQGHVYLNHFTDGILGVTRWRKITLPRQKKYL